MNEKLTVKFKKINPEAKLPEYAHDYDSGMDLFSTIDIMIQPKTKVLIPTGLVAEIPKPTNSPINVMAEIQIRSKSGLALKNALFVLNSPGTVDAGYTGEIGVIIYNAGNEPYLVSKGSKIAQAVVCPVFRVNIEETTEVTETSRGSGGFGSTGV